MTCIALSGVDGTGKTTTSRLLASYLSRYGSTCTHWFRGTHLLASLLSRLLSRFSSFSGSCNPYYGICIPSKLRWLWTHIEFWSLIPHVLTRFLLRLFCRYLICDRGFLDFIAWVITTLNYPESIRGVYGRFLLRLASRERPVYLYADLKVLARRADVSKEFVSRELAVYSVLAKYVSSCSVDTGSKSPLECLRHILRCLSRETH